jgi:hypothetical protein
MTSIFNKLPKELQHMVHEYNTEHRPLMRNVMNQLLLRLVHNELFWEHEMGDLPFLQDEITCDSCGIGISECENFEYPSCDIMFNNYSFCCGYCKWDVEYDIRKSYKRQQRALQNL